MTRQKMHGCIGNWLKKHFTKISNFFCEILEINGTRLSKSSAKRLHLMITPQDFVHRFRGSGRPWHGGGGPKLPVWILKRLGSVFINACCLLSALPSSSQFGRGRLSLVVISFYTLSLLFKPCHLSEFTLAGPLRGLVLFYTATEHGWWIYNVHVKFCYGSC